MSTFNNIDLMMRSLGEIKFSEVPPAFGGSCKGYKAPTLETNNPLLELEVYH
jgi:hypothetical protein